MKEKYRPGIKYALAVIGYGVQGHFDLDTALKVPGWNWLVFVISIQAGW